jgi:hypothetical protein
MDEFVSAVTAKLRTTLGSGAFSHMPAGSVWAGRARRG